MPGASERTSSDFGELLRTYRLAAALSQEALAERAGLSVDAVRAIERGRRMPRPDTLGRLVEALGLGDTDQRSLIGATWGDSPASREEGAAVGPERPLPATGLIGRTRELSMLIPALDAVVAGEGRTLLLSGKAGVGKSRLAEEVARHARERGFQTVVGRCFEAEQAVPYLPFRDIIAGLLRAAPDAIRESVDARWPYLGPLLPDLSGVRPMPATSDEQFRVHFAVASFLETMAERAPLLVLLEDLHWADHASLQLLHYLVVHRRSPGILILGTYRDAFVNQQHPLTAIVRDLARNTATERVTLQPLDESATSELVAAVLREESITPELAGLIYNRTAGNPFFVHQIVRTLIETGDIYREEGRWERKEIEEIDVPESVRDVIRQRVGRLSDTTQEVLAEASVLGQSFWARDLGAMSERSEHELEEGLDAAESMGVIHETERGRYDFEHALTRQALYGELPSRRRRRLHRAAAAAIASQPKHEQRASELARHLLEGDRPDEAIPYAILAGDQAEAVFAHAEAEQQYRLALQLAEEVGDDPATILACRKLAAPLQRTSRFREALDVLERAASAYEREDDLTGLVAVMADITTIHSGRGTVDEGLARLEPILPRLERLPASTGLIALLVAYGTLLFVVGRRREHLAVVQRAVDLANDLGDTAARAAAEEQLGLALLSLRRREEARQVLDSAIALAEEAGDLVTLGLALNNAAFLAEVWGEFARSRSLSTRGFELAQRLGDPSQTAFMATALGRNHFYSGNWDESRRWHERAIELSRTVMDSWVAPYLFLAYGQLLMGQGNELESEEAFRQGLALAEANDDVQAREIGWQMLGELDLMRGLPEPAWERFSTNGITEAWDPDQDSLSLPAALVLARILMALHRPVDAESVVDKIIDQARMAGERLVLAEALSLRAILTAGRGAPAEAGELFAEAIALARTIGYPYLEARMRYECSVIVPERERDEMESALAIFRDLGARRHVERVERQLTVRR